jgi:DNA topoisomerase-1
MSKTKLNGRPLVIVESPAKAKTINRFLGSGYIVKASLGHVRDLPQREFGVDVSDNFRPTYEIVRGRARVLAELRKLASNAPCVYLATDRDREGEAIAWHLVEALQLDPAKVRRVVFNEITERAIKEAFQNPREINLDRVNAQQARRILDRIVGYELSPLLWGKVAKGLSAGRVQSVAVRLIVERERQIREFVPEESWKITADLTPAQANLESLRTQWQALADSDKGRKEVERWLQQHRCFRTELVELGGRPFKPADVEQALTAARALGYDGRQIDRRVWDEYAHLKLEQVRVSGRIDPQRVPLLTVADLKTRRTLTRPPPPFTTATLQQAAANVLRFSAARTMRTAQELYEGVELPGEGSVGLITYMRTDSTNLAAEAVEAVRAYLREHYGSQYVPERPVTYASRQARAQEAHEAIRPTDLRYTPERVKEALSSDQFKLYELIWNRFLACQMPPAEWEATTVTVTCSTALGEARFVGTGRRLLFDGFMRVAGVTSEDQLLPAVQIGQVVTLVGLLPRQVFSSPPPRYTEASLVKALESEGIGRPSTYATIIETIQERGYVEQIDRKFYPTVLGELVTDKLIAHFPQVMDVKFTSFMEDELDKIEEAQRDWVAVLREFYDPFQELLRKAENEMKPARSLKSPYTCPQCGSPMVYRWSKAGRFLACSSYPRCRGTLSVDREGRPLVQPAEPPACERCGRPMVLRQSRSGPFLGCSGYPECRNTVPCDDRGQPLRLVTEAELQRPCEVCGSGTMVVKRKGRRAFLGCNRFPECDNTAPLPPGVRLERKPAPPPEPAGITCDQCGRPMVIRKGRRGTFIACSGYPRCRNTKPAERLEELRAAEPQPIPAESEELKDPPHEGEAAPHPQFGPPPPGFAWTRTGKPVVDVLPAAGKLRCPQCGGLMGLKRGRFGPFLSCENFPRCRFVANLRGQAREQAEQMLPKPARTEPIPTDIPCQECGSPMLVRKGRRGRFLGCSNYPRCKATRPLPPDFKIEPAPAAVAAPVG